MQPEDTEKSRDTERGENLHKLRVEHLLRTRAQLYHDAECDRVHDGNQGHDQERVVHHGSKAARQGGRNRIHSDSHARECSTPAPPINEM